MSDRPAVILDSVVVLQAALRPAGRLLALLDFPLFTLYVSQTALDEYADVLGRPPIRTKNPHLTATWVAAFLERLERHATLIRTVPGHVRYPRDPDDEHILNLAIEAGAQYVVTRDRDLLDLMDETRREAPAFRERYPHLAIVDPEVFLRRLADTSNSPPGSS